MNPKTLLSAIVFSLISSCLLAQTAPTAADLVKQGQKLNSEGKQDEAIALYKQAIHLSPDDYTPYLNGGFALDLKGEYGEARHHFQKALELAPPDNKPQVMRALAVSYAFEGNAAEAAKYEQQVFDARLAKQDFSGAAEIANEMGRIALESGDTAMALDWYKKGYDTALRKADLSEADKNLWLFRWENAQGRIAARSGKRGDAAMHVAVATAALDNTHNPDQAAFLPYLTGYVAFYLGDYKKAIADLDKANQHDPFILVLLAQAYEKSDDKAHAMEFYKKVLEINGHGPTNAFARPLARKKIGG
jgi:tetratricopeptide (TPR) repeat protein